jgi:8-oxo-dGTP pyrophosphatase MutT (NUDIX family)
MPDPEGLTRIAGMGGAPNRGLDGVPHRVPTAPAEAVPTRLAATVVLIRDAATGPEVLLLRRHSRSGFAASAWVFPGGVVDAGDATVPATTWSGLDPVALAPRFGLPAEAVLGLHVAAVRETFEEAGILLATTTDGAAPDLADPAFASARRVMNDRDATLDWGAFCLEQGLVMDLAAVTYFSHWITPIQEPRRYDTRFFVAALPAGAVASADDVETTEARWTSPRAALEDEALHIIFPTARTLEALEAFPSAAACADHAVAQPAVPTVQPHIMADAEGRYVDIVLPDDPRYPHHIYRVGR